MDNEAMQQALMQALQQRGQEASMRQYTAQLPDAKRDAMFTPYQQQQAQIQDQIDQAKALRKPGEHRYGSVGEGFGAAFGNGLADMFNNISGGIQQRSKEAEMAQALRQMQKNASNQTGDYAKWSVLQQQPPGMPGMPGAAPALPAALGTPGVTYL